MDAEQSGEAWFIVKGTMRNVTDYDVPRSPVEREYVVFRNDYREHLTEVEMIEGNWYLKRKGKYEPVRKL